MYVKDHSTNVGDRCSSTDTRGASQPAKNQLYNVYFRVMEEFWVMSWQNDDVMSVISALAWRQMYLLEKEHMRGQRAAVPSSGHVRLRVNADVPVLKS